MSKFKQTFGFFIKENKLEEALKIFEVFGAKVNGIEHRHSSFEEYWRVTVRTTDKDFNIMARQIHNRCLHICDEKIA